MAPTSALVQSCLNCQTSVDYKSVAKYSSAFSEAYKVQIFQTFAEGFQVESSCHNIQACWDFSTETLPFCISCLSFIRELHGFKQGLVSMQESMRQLVLILRTKLLESMDKVSPMNPGIPEREAEFRSLAASRFLPVVDLPRVPLESRTPSGRKNASNQQLAALDPYNDTYDTLLPEFPAISSSFIDDDEFQFTEEVEVKIHVEEEVDILEEDPLKIDNDFLSNTIPEDVALSATTLVAEPVNIKRRLKSVRISRHKKLTGLIQEKQNQKWLRLLPDGREFLQGVEVRTIDPHNFECGVCNRRFNVKQYLVSHIKALHLGIRRKNPKSHSQRLTKLLRRFRSTASKSSSSSTRQKKPRIRKPRRLVQLKKTKWILQGEDGKEYIGDVEVITLSPDSYQCGKCFHKTNAKANLTQHIKYRHCGMKRQKPKRLVEEAARKVYQVPRWLEKKEDGREFVSGVEVIPLEGKKFKCGECSAICKTKNNAVIHIRRAHVPQPREPITQNVDGKFFIRDIELIQEGERCWVCSLCNHKLRNKFNLGWHIRKVHFGHQWNRDKDMPVNPVTPTEKQKCPMPIKRITTSDGKQFYGKVEIKRLENGGHSCTVCEKSCKTYSAILCHIRRKHIPELPGAICDVCNLKFDAPSKMELHRVSHFAEKLFICEQCGVGCKRRSALNDHVRRVHDRLRRNNCEICGKEFYSKKDLRKHLESHGIHEYQFQCGECLAKFPFGSFLRKHEGECEKVKISAACTGDQAAATTAASTGGTLSEVFPPLQAIFTGSEVPSTSTRFSI